MTSLSIMEEQSSVRKPTKLEEQRSQRLTECEAAAGILRLRHTDADWRLRLDLCMLQTFSGPV